MSGPFLGSHLRLQGYGVQIGPMAAGLVPDLWDAMEPDPETFKLFTEQPASWTEAGFTDYVSRRTREGYLCHAVIVGEKCVGSTTLFDVRARDRSVEIGFTFYGPAFRGTKLNPVCKLLLIRDLIENQGANRVQLKTDSRNVRSQKAMEKLGFVKEGTLRRTFVMPDGHVRDTVYYSVVPSDWPAVERQILQWIELQPQW